METGKGQRAKVLIPVPILLTSLIRPEEKLLCRQCGTGMECERGFLATKERRYYACSWVRKTASRKLQYARGHEGPDCKMPRVPAEEIEDQIFQRIMFYLIRPNRMIEYIEKQIGPDKGKGLSEEAKRLREKLTREKTRLERFLDLYGDGAYSTEELNTKVQSTRAEIARLEDELSGMELKLSLRGNQRAELDRLKKALLEDQKARRSKQREVIFDLEKLSLEDKKKLFRLVVNDRIVIKHIGYEKGLTKPKPKFGIEGTFNLENAWNFLKNPKNSSYKYPNEPCYFGTSCLVMGIRRGSRWG